MTVDIRGFDQDVRHTRIVDPQQALIAAVDALANTVDDAPPVASPAFLQSVDALVDTIDALSHRPAADEPERGLDRAADILADTIRHVVHERPSENAGQALLLDALARPMEALIHIGDASPGATPGLLHGIDTMAETVGAVADLVTVQPGPCRLLADALDTLAHSLANDALATSARTLDGALRATAQAVAALADSERPADGAVHTLAHAIDAMVDAEPAARGGPGGALIHSVDALTDSVDALIHAAFRGPAAAEHALRDGVHSLAHGADALVHTLPMIEPVAASSEEAEYIAAVDHAVHAVDLALRGGPDGHGGLLPAVQDLARAIGAIVPCVVPAPVSGVDLALDALAHGVDFVAHEGTLRAPDPALIDAIGTLTHSVDALVHHQAIDHSGGFLL